MEGALHAWEDAAARDRRPVVRRGAELQKRALEDHATAVSRTPLERYVGSAREDSGCGRPWRRKVTDQDPRTEGDDGAGDGERPASWSGK
ncbi:hypothetical protein San01_13050 [Streptomyces angustmyceticus]|uniref:Uncharacterized protein n=1 Tax=Streptomyces angustmyceticus TaxID=285578 RepID=A0A5J4LDV4_9ACTN|nr:hypothetical protein San01_13050 [Streptomyces angustmyceticus]